MRCTASSGVPRSLVTGAIPQTTAVSGGTSPATEGQAEDSRSSGISQRAAAASKASRRGALVGRAAMGGRSSSRVRRHLGPPRPRVARIAASASSAWAASTYDIISDTSTRWGTNMG